MWPRNRRVSRAHADKFKYGTGKMKNTQQIKEGLLLLGAFGIAYNLAVLLHELSHGLAAILTGGTFSDMVINPFSWSYCYSFSPSQLVQSSSGALGAILIAGAIYLIFYWKANPWLFPLLLIAPIALMYNGIYYVVDIIMHSGGDACRLTGMGIHPAILIASGATCVIIGLILSALLIRKMGLFLFDFKGRLVVLMLGVAPSTLAMLIWNCVFNRNEVFLWTMYTAATIVLTLIIAVIPKRAWKSDVYKPQQLKWKTVATINLFYIGLLIFWFVGPFSEKNVLGVETFSEHPADFPAVVTAPDFATDVTYSCSPNLRRPYSLFYDIPESTPPEQIRDYINNIHNQYGYVLLTHSINDPNEIHNDNWKDATYETNGISLRIKQYRQSWLKIDSCPLESFVAVTYVWEKDKIIKASVRNNIFEYPEFEQLYNYAMIHPKQFDPNEIEQLRTLSLAQKETLQEQKGDKGDLD